MCRVALQDSESAEFSTVRIQFVDIEAFDIAVGMELVSVVGGFVEDGWRLLFTVSDRGAPANEDCGVGQLDAHFPQIHNPSWTAGAGRTEATEVCVEVRLPTVSGKHKG
jgi:hypothetical protein